MTRRTALALIAPVLLVTAGCISTRIENASPFNSRNQHPVHLTVIHAPARPARAPEAGKVQASARVDWTSHWLLPGTGGDEVLWDGETVRTEFGGRVGIGDHLDLETNIPFLYAGGGTLDGFIEGFHDFFGLPQNNRDDFPRDELNLSARRRDESGHLRDAFRVDGGGIRLCDIPVFLSWFPYRTDDTSVGLRGGIEFPTGDENRGDGNGGFDGYLGFLSQYDGIGFSAFGWGGHSFVSTPEKAKDLGLDYADSTSLGAGAQVALTETIFAMATLEYETSVLRNMDDDRAGLDQLLLVIGGRYRIAEDMDLDVGVGEGLLEDVSPDVWFHFGFNYRF